MKNEKISIIVPVYNVENYVEKCLDSLMNQTYKNIEIIIVNDCSTDDSELVIKKKIKDTNYIKYIKNEVNSGLSFSRNTGLKNATGEYISYIDSDDYIPIDFYEQMMKTRGKDNSDIVICDINIVDESGNTIQKTYCGGKKKIDFIDNGLAASACNKIFKKEIMEKYEFSVGKVNEDLAVVLPAIIHAKKVSYCKNTCYYYIQRNSSIQNSSFSGKRFDIFYGVKLTLERIEGVEDYSLYKQLIIYHQLIMLFIYVIPKEESFKKRLKWLKKFNELSLSYSIRQNPNYWRFLEKQPIKSRYYYKLLFKLNCNKMYLFSNLLIEIMNLYKYKLKKRLIKKDISLDDLILAAKRQKGMKNQPVTISVIIPNYNYAKFLYQRLYSILNQTQKINEIIILDDCSMDNSRELIDKTVLELEPYISIKKVYNEKNSGSAFKQWEKGFSLAKSDYVWIAEADDYCEFNLLKRLVKPILKNNEIIISYADTAFIDKDGRIILNSINPEIDIMKTNHWKDNFVNSGKDEYEKYAFLNCTIANVSSCIIKNDDYTSEFNLSSKYHQAGDWLFYVNIMMRGQIAYTAKALNYYRVHGNNVSSTMKHDAHLKEIESIHEYFEKEFGLNKFQKKQIEKRYKFLKDTWDLKD